MNLLPTENHIVLLTTSGCSLCEKAKLEIWPILNKYQLAVIEWDIIHHPYLLNAFAVHIPVLISGQVLLKYHWLNTSFAANSTDNDLLPLIEAPVHTRPNSILTLEETGLYWPFTQENIEYWLTCAKDF